ncbi:bifunctional hydroxymethylpyrimidine kinase/phosphomethylpyrimidine kinase [Arachnia propionica]|uniref:Bifunctional hydroxymethylpyrimidine kinase/phosphomethylpyrimidine kinase n=1 Tax=Arachnia propionica TaxID=1750 RepID=A0A3P1WTN4_9ACTN|nr:bifunctional hydroxymethylpyrimidine kinase/phosphomethylpyrimidine kinase [Arachnia propionica]RRD49531.1 bifunctional hydroxymethylpyrimidine kinase/phosphomethylpyrimidine kinase [Arachnia propionica]
MKPPVALSIAGSDPSGGAGIQADLKTFSALGVYGCAAIAGLTVQNTQGVRAAQALDPGFVVDQVTAVVDDIAVDATKLGMLTNAGVAGAVADLLASRRKDFGTIVLDPVMVATSGDALLAEDAVEVMRTRLMPLADVITPNVPETAVLLDEAPATSSDELADQAQRLVQAGARAVLAKGGHLDGDELTDLLVTPEDTIRLTSPRIHTRNTHGTGCTLSSAVAACVARSGVLDVATVERARDYLHRAIVAGATWRLSRTPDSGHGPVNHLVEGAS